MFYPKNQFVQPVKENNIENLSTDAGLLIFRQWEEKYCFTEGFAQQLNDHSTQS